MAGKRRESSTGANDAVSGVSKVRSFGGYGESKNFGDPNAKPEINWNELTVNGKPIPEYMHGRLLYSQTDQGMKEAAEGKEVWDGPKIQFVRDRTDYSQIDNDDQKLAKYRGDLESDEFQVASDPFAPLVKKFTPEGHVGMMMGKLKTDKEGMVRNGMEYEPVLVDGKQVRSGGMFLASVPKDLHDKSERYFAGLARAKQVSAVEKVQEQSSRIMGESSLRDLARSRRVMDDISGLQIDDASTADAELLAHESA